MSNGSRLWIAVSPPLCDHWRMKIIYHNNDNDYYIFNNENDYYIFIYVMTILRQTSIYNKVSRPNPLYYLFTSQGSLKVYPK